MSDLTLLLRGECPSLSYFPDSKYRIILLVVFLEYFALGLYTVLRTLLYPSKSGRLSYETLFMLIGASVMFIRAYTIIFPVSDPSDPPEFLKIILVCNEIPLALQFILICFFVLFLLSSFNFLRMSPSRHVIPALFISITSTLSVSLYAARVSHRDDAHTGFIYIDLFNMIVYTILFFSITFISTRIFSSLSKLSMSVVLRTRIEKFKSIIFIYSFLQLFRSFWSLLLFLDVNVLQQLFDTWLHEDKHHYRFFLVYFVWCNVLEILPWIKVITVMNPGKRKGNH
ncbi:hypothetical protein GEMRC1_004854 [Eukaryota sp. GEM-RC1]